jgi:hypothetical protein
MGVATAIVQWKTRIIDLDLRAYFDTVRHHLLLERQYVGSMIGTSCIC